jgi:hypothetical protein
LPEEFTTEDVMRCFNLGSNASARMRISRLVADRIIEKSRQEIVDGAKKAYYRKTGVIML